jgi:hypothetical protein
MITVPTHKRQKSPFKHSKTIYGFTSEPVLVTVQIHKDFGGVKMTTAKSASIQELSRLYAILLQDLMKRGVCRRALEMLLAKYQT